MPNLNETLEAIGTELAGLLATDSTPATVEMTLDDFVSYCKQQIDLAKADANPADRVKHIHEIVSLAKAYSWEDGGTMNVPVFTGPESEPAQSAAAEKIAEHPGMGLGVPGPQATPADGAFEQPGGVAGPSGNTVRPAASHMPPAFPQSEPAASAEGFMAKAASVLAKAENGDALLAELKGMLNAEAQPGDEKASHDDVKKDDGWPLDLSTPHFLEDKPAVSDEDDFGTDPSNLGRGKLVG